MIDWDDIELLPSRYNDASFLRNVLAIAGSMDIKGVGKLVVADRLQEVSFQCQWEPYVTESELIVVYYKHRNNRSFLVLADKGFLENITVV